jgi:hypothetical protein
MRCNNNSDDSTLIECYCDSTWTGSNDYKTMGYIILLNGSPVQWSSGIDKSKINKSCEAEYIALSKAISNTLSLKNLLLEIFPN